MESALAWLEPRAVAPLVAVVIGPGAAPDEAAIAHRGSIYDGLLGSTPAANLVATDLLDGADARARFLAPLVPPGAAVARQAAVWVHTGRLRPAQPAVLVPPHRRIHTGVRAHRQAIAPGDVVLVGAVEVTTPVRTAVDLLCFASEQLAVAGVRVLLAAGMGEAGVREALAATPGLPRRRASARLALATRSTG